MNVDESVKLQRKITTVHLNTGREIKMDGEPPTKRILAKLEQSEEVMKKVIEMYDLEIDLETLLNNCTVTKQTTFKTYNKGE